MACVISAGRFRAQISRGPRGQICTIIEDHYADDHSDLYVLHRIEIPCDPVAAEVVVHPKPVVPRARPASRWQEVGLQIGEGLLGFQRERNGDE
jgi:hypothetical protein